MSNADVMTVKELKAFLNELPDNCRVFIAADELAKVRSSSNIFSYGFGIVEDGAAFVKLVCKDDSPLFNALILFPS